MRLDEIATNKIQYQYAGGDFEDDDDFDYVQGNREAYNLADKAGLNILRDKEPFVYTSLRGKVIGCLFVTDSNQKYSFDIVVSPKFRNLGIGSKLVDIAIQEYNERKPAYNEYDYNIDVVSPSMKSILLKKGFSVLQELGSSHWIMGQG